jgi:hypothetical protein
MIPFCLVVSNINVIFHEKKGDNPSKIDEVHHFSRWLYIAPASRLLLIIIIDHHNHIITTKQP